MVTQERMVDGSKRLNKKQTSILVIDDDLRILKLLKTILTFAGYGVITASGGEDGLQLNETEKPGIILLDLSMPGVNGFEVLNRLQTLPKVPVIAVSAHNSFAEEALRLGASEFIAKPFRPETLLSKVRAVLEP